MDERAVSRGYNEPNSQPQKWVVFFFPSSLGNIELLLWRYRNVKKVYSCAFTQRIVCQGYVQSEPEELKLLHVQGAAAPHYPVQM